MNDVQAKAKAEFDRCSERIRKAPTFREGGRGAEYAYSAAYSAMVRVGIAPPLRRKYR